VNIHLLIENSFIFSPKQLFFDDFKRILMNFSKIMFGRIPEYGVSVVV